MSVLFSLLVLDESINQSVNETDEAEHEANHHASEGLVMFIGVMLLIGCLCRMLVKRFPRVPLPFTVLLLFLGVLIGAIANIQSDNTPEGQQVNVFHSAVNQFTDISPHLALYIFLPVLIFDSGFNVHYHLFIQSLGASLTLAVPGALLALFSVAILSKFGFDYDWNWGQALMLGSILSTTDPIAVVSLLRELGASQQLAMLIESESLMNDGAAFVIYLVTQSALLGGDASAGAVVKRLVQYSIGGPAFGYAVAVATVMLMGVIYSDAEVEISITIAVTYVCFWVADSPLGLSGVLSIAMLGVYMSKHRYVVSPSVQPNLVAVWQLLIFCVNILVFVLSGLIIADKLIGTRKHIRGIDVVWLICLYVLLHVVRYASLLLFWPLFRRMGITLTWRDITMMGWSGMRGAISLLLALITYLEPAYDQKFRDRLMFQVSGIVLLTLIVNGITSRYLMSYLGLNKGTPESRMVLNSALSHMRQQTASAIRQMKADPKFKAVSWPQLRPFLPQQLIQELQQEQGLSDILSPVDGMLSDSDNNQSGNQSDGQYEDQPFHVVLPENHPMRRMYSMQSMGDLTLAAQPTFPAKKSVSQSADGSNNLFSPLSSRATERSILSSSHTLEIPNRTNKLADQARSQTSNTARQVIEPSSVELQPVFSPAPDASELTIRISPANRPLPVSSVLDENQPISRSIGSPINPRRASAPFASVFDAPSQQELDDLAMKLDPPYNPPAPPFPPLTAQSSESVAQSAKQPVINQSNLRSVKGPPRPMHRRAMTAFMSSSDLSNLSIVNQHKLNLHRELTNRFITAMAADYHKQFSSGLISTDTLRILVAAAGAATDEASLSKHWSFIKSRLRPPRWLWALFVSPLNTDTVPFYIKPVRSFIRRLMFDHLKVAVELATAYLSAKQRLEYVLSAFPEFDEIDEEVVNQVRKQAGYYQRRALDAWMDVCEGYFEAHAAVVTRHAAILLLHYQQAEIASLQSTGMLEPNEYDHIASLISQRLIQLERRRLDMPLTPSIEMLFQLPIFACLTGGQQRKLRQILGERSLHRWYRGHEQIWKCDEPSIGLMIVVRGTVRSLFEYGDIATVHSSINPRNRSRRTSHSRKYATPRNNQAHSANPPAITSSTHHSKDRYFETKGSGTLLGSYEALTDQCTLAAVSSVTMVEAFVLDRDCIELLMQEDEFALSLIRAAAVVLVKAYWVDWKIGELIDQSSCQLHQYQLSMLMERAAVHRVDRHEIEMEVRVDDRVLLLKGRARGRSIKRRVPLHQASNHQNNNYAFNKPIQRSFPQSQDDQNIPQKRKRSEPTSRDCSDIILQTDQSINPLSMPLASSMLKPLVIPDSDQPVISAEPQSTHSVSMAPHFPVYPAPCFLSQRRGVMSFEQGSIFLMWTRRDEHIASLHPPPPRAHLKEYAQQLGLTMGLAFSQPVDQAANQASKQQPPPQSSNRSAQSNYVPGATLQSMDVRIGSYLGLPSMLNQPEWDPSLTVGANARPPIIQSKPVNQPVVRPLAVRRSSVDMPSATLRNQPINQQNNRFIGSMSPAAAQNNEQWTEVDEDEYDSDHDDVRMDVMNQSSDQPISDADLAKMIEQAQNELYNARTI